jgi:glycine/serine hydroxymethyltransferase
MGISEMAQIATWIKRVFDHVEDDQELAKIKGEVENLAKKFPLYPVWS